MVNNIAARSPPTSKKGIQAFLGAVGFWRMHIWDYSQIFSPLYQVTQEKNDLKWGPEQQQAFEQIKQEMVLPVALGPIWCFTPHTVWDMCSTWQLGRMTFLEELVRRYLERPEADLWVLQLGYKGSEACYAPAEKRSWHLWRGLNCLRSDWYQSIVPFGAPTASAGQDVWRESPFHTLCYWCHVD